MHVASEPKSILRSQIKIISLIKEGIFPIFNVVLLMEMV